MKEHIKELSQAFLEMDTASVSDALDRLGIVGGLHKIAPVVPGTGKKVCGPAFTVHYVPVGQVKQTVGDFLDDVEAGMIVVIDNGGRDYCTVWGDIMSTYAAMKDIAGTVIDGVCRDVKLIREINYPIYTKGIYMVTGKDRVGVDSVNIPISVSNVQVRPGDLVLCDDNGAIVIPIERAEDVLKVAREIERKETNIIAALKEGTSLKEARAKNGYHTLQSRQ